MPDLPARDSLSRPPLSRAQNERRVVRYFDGIRFDVTHFWTDSTTLGIHFGYWHADTRSLREALRNTNRALAERAALQPGDHVLDAGCGLGGGAIWLAETYGVRVTGVTLSHDQARRARRAAAQRGVGRQVDFVVLDFQCMALPAAAFDVVWAMESVSYAWEKADFAREAYRLLRPGGRLVLSDGFRTRRPFSPADEAFMQRFAIGWGTPDYVTEGEFLAALRAAGFCNLRFEDESEHTLPTVERLHRTAGLVLPISRVLHRLGLLSEVRLRNAESCYLLRELVARGLGIYGIVTAGK